jgi:DNA-binding MarR family transcriptional regulator
VSRALDALQGLGLANRIPDETDRRSVLVQTTARGLAVLAGLGDRVIACEKAQSVKKSPDLKPTASSQPPVHRPVAQPSAPRDSAGPSSHAA